MGAVSEKAKGMGKRVRMTLDLKTQNTCLPALSAVLGISETDSRELILYVPPLKFCAFMAELSHYAVKPNLSDLNIEFVSITSEPRIIHVKG